MKRILFLLLAVMMLAGCDKGGDDSPITGYDRKQLNQTLYADQTEGSFSFTATESWTTRITDLTPGQRAAASDIWITLDPSQGEAGTVKMKITLTPNLTGADRKATIRIVCGDTTITITIEQKATNGGGDEPDPGIPATPGFISRIDSFWDGAADGHMTFEYDDQGRTTEFRLYDKAGVLDYKEAMTYTSGKIRIVSVGGENDPEPEITLITLDASGRALFREETINGKEYKFEYKYDADGYLTDYYSGGWIETDVAPDPRPFAAADGAVKPIMDRAVWENGNLKTLYSDWEEKYGIYEDKTEFEYTNHPNGFATIDLTMGATISELSILKTGTFGKIRKNLIARETVTGRTSYNTGVHNWSYKFDKDNRLTEFTRAFTAGPLNPDSNYTETYKISYK